MSNSYDDIIKRNFYFDFIKRFVEKISNFTEEKKDLVKMNELRYFDLFYSYSLENFTFDDSNVKDLYNEYSKIIFDENYNKVLSLFKLCNNIIIKKYIPSCLINLNGNSNLIDLRFDCNKDSYIKFVDILNGKDKQNYIDIFLEAMNKLCKIVYLMLKDQKYVFYLNPYFIYINKENGLLLFDWFVFSNSFISSDNLKVNEKIIESNLNNNRRYIYRKLRAFIGSNIDRKEIDNHISLYSIFYLILEFFFGINFEAKINSKFDGKFSYEDIVKIEKKFGVRNFLEKIIERIKSKNIEIDYFQKITSEMEKILKKKDNNIENINIYTGYETSSGGKENNEDKVGVVSSDNGKSFLFFVADGVSTTDIYESRMVANLLDNYFISRKEGIKDFLNGLESIEDKKLLKERISFFLKERLNDINCYLYEEIKKEIDKNENKIEEIKYFPSSTLILGIVRNNYCVLANIGDSDFILIKDNELYFCLVYQIIKNFILINAIEGQEEQEEIEDLGENNFDSIYLTIPNLNIENNEIKLEKIDKYADFYDFFVNDKDLVIVATDGLRNMIGEDHIEIQNNIMEIVKKYNLNNDANSESLKKKVKRIAEELCKRATERKFGYDNVTALVMFFSK